MILEKAQKYHLGVPNEGHLVEDYVQGTLRSRHNTQPDEIWEQVYRKYPIRLLRGNEIGFTSDVSSRMLSSYGINMALVKDSWNVPVPNTLFQTELCPPLDLPSQPLSSRRRHARRTGSRRAGDRQLNPHSLPD